MVTMVIGLFCVALEVRAKRPAHHAWVATLISAAVLFMALMVGLLEK